MKDLPMETFPKFQRVLFASSLSVAQVLVTILGECSALWDEREGVAWYISVS